MALFTLAAPPLFSAYAFFDVLVLTGIWGIAALGTGLLSGYGGQVSLGQGAVLGLGAYAAALAVTEWGMPEPLGVLLAIGVALAVALITAPLLRLHGFYLALATLALGLIITQAFTNLGGLTGGVSGRSVPPLSVGGTTLDSREASFWTGWVVLTVVLAGVGNLMRSRYGQAFAAIEQDEAAARALGIPVFRYKTALWLIASALTAVSGALYAHHLQFLSPDQFGIDASVQIVAAVIIGGTGLRLGPVLGMWLLQALPQATRDLGVSTPLATGVLMIAVMVFFPGGLSEALLRLGRLRRTRKET
ncbi:branched-chain amino acid ABC transporter permease [Streptomyces sp. NPDC047108]|uniref:branched-chain amino acid ABC transporter permease n=1 Tax=Streptomyces sp. NPDC047108 TaxID=3155025 RepID=UPI0033FF6A14